MVWLISTSFQILQYVGGEYGQKITILHRDGGVYQDPQNALSNLWTTPKGGSSDVEIFSHFFPFFSARC